MEDLEQRPVADRFPAYSQLVVDARSNLWVRDFRPGFEEGPHRWLVLDPEGRVAGRVETPARFVVHEIGDDYILGVAWDALNVERVRLYGLRKP